MEAGSHKGVETNRLESETFKSNRDPFAPRPAAEAYSGMWLYGVAEIVVRCIFHRRDFVHF